MTTAGSTIRRRGAERIVLVGSSMGATAALVAATRIGPRVGAAIRRFVADQARSAPP